MLFQFFRRLYVYSELVDKFFPVWSVSCNVIQEFATTVVYIYLFFALQINVNGYVSLDYPYIDPNPKSFPVSKRAMIAPFWADLDLSSGGSIFYQQYFSYGNTSGIAMESQIFNATTAIISNSTGDASFVPSMIIKITWQNVAPYPSATADATEVCKKKLRKSCTA